MKDNTRTRSFVRLGWFLLAAAIWMCMPAVSLQAAGGVGAPKRTQAQIRKYLSKNMPSLGEEIVYTKKPSASKPYKTGKISDKTLKSALRMVNCFRYIAGLGSVKLDKSCTELAQAASLANAANFSMSHNPPKPSGMSKSLYAKAVKGAGSSNLAYGFKNLNDSIQNGWIADDVGEHNVTTAGHRRWTLDPRLKEVGFGAVRNRDVLFTAMCYRSAGSRESKISSVAWPAVNTPANLFDGYGIWSLSVNHSIAASDQKKIKATLLRKSDGKLWRFYVKGACDGNLGVSNGCGMGGAVVFQPKDLYKDMILDGDEFLVTVTGLPESIQYTVHFFALSSKVSRINLDTDTWRMQVGELSWIPGFSVEPATAAVRPVFRSSDTGVVEVNQQGELYGVDEGEADITISCGGKQAKFRVIVSGIADNLSEDFMSDSEIKARNKKALKKNMKIVTKQLKNAGK